MQHYRNESIQASSTFSARWSLVGSQKRKKRCTSTCFSWRLMVRVYVESCYISFFEEAKFHLCISLGNSRTGERGECVVCVFKEDSGWHLSLIHTSAGTASSAQVYHSSERLTVSRPPGVKSSAHLLQWEELIRKKKSVSQVHGSSPEEQILGTGVRCFGGNKALLLQRAANCAVSPQS